MNDCLLNCKRDENFSYRKDNSKEVSFAQNAFDSLREVECFLNNFKHYYKFIYLYKFLK